MATITFTLSAAHASRVEDAMAALYMYEPIIDGESNPESKTAFAKRMITDLIKERVRTAERTGSIQVFDLGFNEITLS